MTPKRRLESGNRKSNTIILPGLAAYSAIETFVSHNGANRALKVCYVRIPYTKMIVIHEFKTSKAKAFTVNFSPVDLLEAGDAIDF